MIKRFHHPVLDSVLSAEINDTTKIYWSFPQLVARTQSRLQCARRVQLSEENTSFLESDTHATRGGVRACVFSIVILVCIHQTFQFQKNE